jgi:hypothetical protein
MGDLNLPLMDWINKSAPDNVVYSEILAFLMSNSFTQVVNFPTRDSNILDVILVDDPTIISGVHSSAPLGSSDHVCIVFNIELLRLDSSSYISSSDNNNGRSIITNHLNLDNYNLLKADWPMISEFLNGINWNEALNYFSINECWESFYSIIVHAVSLYAPVKKKWPKNRSYRKQSSNAHKHYPLNIRKILNKKANA